jgi:helix-turn-helix protein
MWAHLQRLGVPVARCTIERLMRENGWRGATRARKVRTTVADPAAERAPDLVKRHFKAECPDELWVADFTSVPMISGFGYTAFIIDAFAGQNPVEQLAAQCSDHAFADRVRSGAPGGLVRIRMPSASKALLNLESRSRSTNLRVVTRPARSISRLRAAWVVHAPVGCALIPSRCARREPCSAATRT